jgi:negative regulator of sigma E activity
MDAGSTQIIERTPDPATEIIGVGPGPVGPPVPPKTAVPQEIPARDEASNPVKRQRRSWGWVLAVVLVIAALAALAILGLLLLTRDNEAKVSQEDLVRSTIQTFDGAIQKGDLAALRGITCGETADSYNKYDDRKWADIHARVAAAQQYPVVASIDKVVVNGDHAEANVTSFMAFDPVTRSTRSFDLQFRDDKWKICQAPGS